MNVTDRMSAAIGRPVARFTPRMVEDNTLGVAVVGVGALLLLLGSMAFFYVLHFLVRPFRGVQVMWRVLRGRPFTWLERFLHAGFRQYVLQRKVSRLATTTQVAPAVGTVHIPRIRHRPVRAVGSAS